MFKVEFFKRNDGSYPVLEFIESQQRKDQDKIYSWLVQLEELGNRLRRPHADYLTEGIYELRVHRRNIQYRILYFFDHKKIILTNAFIKKSDKVDPKEIDKAVKYKLEYHKKQK